MKKLILLIVIVSVSTEVFSQKYISEQNKVSFFSEAPMENIEAHSYKSKSMFDTGSKEIVFSIPIRTFEFEKSLMQEHFNENYMESGKYPRARFKGQVEDFVMKEGTQSVLAKGDLEIHGVTKPVSVGGEIEIRKFVLQQSSRLQLQIMI